MAPIWEVGERVYEGADPGNITVLEEPESEEGPLRYLVYRAEFGWAWSSDIRGEDYGRDFESTFKVRSGAYLVVRRVKEAPRVPQTVRAQVLDEAKRITASDRNSAYGEPEDNFQRIADYWNVWLQDRLKDGEKITPGDTAAMQIFVKMAREMNAPKADNKVDLAGYAACWAEVDSKEGE